MVKKQRFKYHFLLGFFGLIIGFCLHFIGFSDFGEVHKLFTFADLRLLLTFMGAVGLAMIGFAVLARGKKLPTKPLHKGTVPGGMLFGAGWAITGSCPAIVLVQLGEGKIPAFATIIGMLLGVWIFRRLKPKYFRWSASDCSL